MAAIAAAMLWTNSSYAAVTFLKGAAVGISETGIVAGNSKFFGKGWTVGMDDAYNYDAKTGRDASHMYVPNGVDSFCETTTNAISDNGAFAVGTFGYDPHAVVWPDHHAATPGIGKRSFSSINDSGSVTGDLLNNGRTTATKWDMVNDAQNRQTRDTSLNWNMVALYTPETGSSKAADINNAGVVVGQITDNGTTVATVWNGANATYLANPSGGSSFASSINDAGQVVGTSGGYATLWDNGLATTLGIGQALSISGSGLIAGYSFTQDNNKFAALWNNGQTIDLNSYLSDADRSAGWLLQEATGVNSDGYVVGKAINMNTGAVAGFVTPVPEPETYALMMGGLGLVGAAVRRKKAMTNV